MSVTDAQRAARVAVAIEQGEEPALEDLSLPELREHTRQQAQAERDAESAARTAADLARLSEMEQANEPWKVALEAAGGDQVLAGRIIHQGRVNDQRVAEYTANTAKSIAASNPHLSPEQVQTFADAQARAYRQSIETPAPAAPVTIISPLEVIGRVPE